MLLIEISQEPVKQSQAINNLRDEPQVLKSLSTGCNKIFSDETLKYDLHIKVSLAIFNVGQFKEQLKSAQTRRIVFS